MTVMWKNQKAAQSAPKQTATAFYDFTSEVFSLESRFSLLPTSERRSKKQKKQQPRTKTAKQTAFTVNNLHSTVYHYF